MRSRVGGFIGPASRPATYIASGMWTLGEEYISRVEGTWPRNYLDLSLSAYFDATQTPDTTIYATYYTNLSPVYSWEKSTNGGSTWAVLSGQEEYQLALTGLAAADNGSLYRVKAVSGLRSKVSSSLAIRYETSFTFDWYSQGGYSGQVGDQASFYIQVNSIIGNTFGSGYYASDVQWQQSTNGGSTWTDISGETSQGWLYVSNIQSGMNNRKYRLRARVSPSHAWYASAPVTLTIT